MDLILAGPADGSEDVVIEINPRLTTSYVGLRRLAQHNLMQTLLAVACGQSPGPLAWRDEVISFHADGRVD
jgi:predicted ATP-grasp superfamily ATP-dependent carboligase